MKALLPFLLIWSTAAHGQNTGELIEKAWNYYDQSMYDSSIVYFDSLINLNPDVARFYVERGNSYFASSRYNLAIRDFEKGIMLDPIDPQPYYQGAICKYYLTNYIEALQDINMVIDSFETFTDAFYLRMDINLKLSEYDRIVDDCMYILQTDSTNYSQLAYTYMGKAYYFLKDYDKCLKALNKAITLMPKNASAYFYRGRCKIDQGHEEDGYQDILQAYEYAKDIDKEVLLLEYTW